MILQLETTSTCNAACHFCVYPDVKDWRAGSLMDMSLYRKIIDEAATIPPLAMLLFHGLGEPIVDPHLGERVKYARSRLGDKVNLGIFTNGVLLTPSKFEALKKAGMNSIVISLNAVNEEQHDLIMGTRGKFDITCANTQYAIDHKGDMEVSVHTVMNNDQFTGQDAYKFIERWGNVSEGGFGMVIREGNWAGEIRTLAKFQSNEHCHRATGSIYVLYDGTVSACCFDPTGKLPFGDLNTQTIREVYSHAKYRQFRQDHINNQADRYDICRTCSRI